MSRRQLMPWEVRRKQVPLLLAAVCCLWVGPANGDPSSNPDINVHRVLLYRNGGLEDSDLARSRRNVLVGAPAALMRLDDCQYTVLIC